MVAVVGTAVPLEAETNAEFFTVPLEEGSQGDDVVLLQDTLRELGFFDKESTGYLGPVTLHAVANFQRANGLPGLGYVGPQTRQLLNGYLNSTSQGVIANTGTQSSVARSLDVLGYSGEANDDDTAEELRTFQQENGISDEDETVTLLTIIVRLAERVLDLITTSRDQAASSGRDNSGGRASGSVVSSSNPSTGGGGGDTTDPTVTISAPSASAVVSGITTVSANASDNVGVVGVQFRHGSTNIGAEDTTAPYTVNWDTTALADGVYTLTAVARDAAGNTVTSTGVAVTVSNASGFSVPDQTLTFGALTASGAGGVAPSATGGSITAATITSGNTLGHWQVSANGTITPTATGDAADLGSGPYTLGINFSSGADTDSATITIATEALTFDVDDRTELIAAFTAAEANDNNLAYTIYVRDNATITGDPGDLDYIRINGIEMNATLNDANDGASESAYDYDATASFSGGSIHLTSRTPHTADIVGSTGIRVSDLNFVHVPDTDSFNRDDGGPNTDTTAAATLYQAFVDTNATFPEESLVIFSSNQFGGKDVNDNAFRWGTAFAVAAANQVVVEDNEFDGFYNGVIFQSVRRGVARRNTFENQLVDSLRAMGTRSSELSGFTLSRIEFTSNVVWDPSNDANWAGAHADGIQIGATGEEVDHDILVKQNYVYLPTAPNVFPGESTERSTQGIYLDDTPSGIVIDGVVAENFVLTTASAGIALWRGAVEVRNNTLVKDTLNTESSGNIGGGSNIRVRNGTGHIIRDNIVDTINDEGGSFTEFDNYAIDHSAASGETYSYFDAFNGPFTNGANGPAWTIDETSSTTLVNGIDSIFAARTESLAETRGFTNGLQDRTPDSLAFVDLTDQTVETQVFTNQQITGISDNTYVIPTNVEWGRAATNNSGDVTEWLSGLGAIDNNEYLHLRATTSASGNTTLTAEIQVGTATTSWSVTTEAGAYVAEAVDFDGTNDYLTTLSYTGATTTQGLLSTWFYADGASLGSGQRIFDFRNAAGQTKLELRAASNNRMVFTAKNAADSNVLNFVSPTNSFSGNTWHHLLIAFDLENSLFEVFVDDTDLAASPSTLVDDTVDALDRGSVGGGFTGSGLWDGYLADVFYTPTYLDITLEANRREFIDASGNPIDLGSDGSNPFSATPELFMSGPTATWHINKGDGGGFTENGEIITAPSSPSD